MGDTFKEEMMALARTPIEDIIAEMKFKLNFLDGRVEKKHIVVGRSKEFRPGLFICMGHGMRPDGFNEIGVGANSFQALNMTMVSIRLDIRRYVKKHSCTFGNATKPLSLKRFKSISFCDRLLDSKEMAKEITKYKASHPKPPNLDPEL